MRFSLQRRVKGQTPFGVFQNLFARGDCGGVKYVEIHLGTVRLGATWKG